MSSHATTAAPKRELHLFDFATLTPAAVADTIIQLLDDCQKVLHQLTAQATPNTLTPKTALTSIQTFNALLAELDRHFNVLSHYNSVLSGTKTRMIYDAILPKLTAFYNAVGQSKALYTLYKIVLDGFDELPDSDKTEAQKRALTLALTSFELSGIALSPDKQQRFADINLQLSQLSSQFANTVLDSTQSFGEFLTEADLDGIPTVGRSLLKKAFDDHVANYGTKDIPKNSTHLATLEMPVYLAIMQYANNRALRQRLYLAYNARASEQLPQLLNTTLFNAQSVNARLFKPKSTSTNNDAHSTDTALNNADTIIEILQLRQEKACLLGYADYSGVSLAKKMADNADEVIKFLTKLAHIAKPYAKKELDELAKFAKETGNLDDLQPWDMPYYSEKLRKQRYNIDSNALRAYFALPKVLDGLFAICATLFGISVRSPKQPVGVWHKDVQFFELYEQNTDELLGGFYLDLYARSNKRGGAWLSGFQVRTHTHLPVGFIVANFTPPTDNHSALLTLDEVITLFHEFGHALHHLLSRVAVADVAGIDSVEWDAVELPSQFMENFVLTKTGMAYISAHNESKEALPKDVLSAIIAAKNFQSGLQTLRQVEFALFDLSIHRKHPSNYQQLLEILKAIKAQISVIDTPHTNRFANSFSHIFAGGYACGYYSYKWAECLSADAFATFETAGIFNPSIGNKFRAEILATAGSRSAKDNFVAFQGRMPDHQALIRQSGFVD